MDADKRRFAIHAGTVLTPLEEIPDCTVVVDDGTITAVGREMTIPCGIRKIDARDKILAPGFIDVHIHGAGGHDLMEATPDAFAAVSRTLARYGTTSFFATTVTASVPATVKALDSISKWIGTGSFDGAQPLAIHMEGPFISHKRLGVHPAALVLPPTVEQFHQFFEAAGGRLGILTIAPETPGADAVIDAAQQRGVRLTMGHTDATFEQAERAIERGIRHAVHTFNAMRPFSHRDPGVIAAVLTDERIAAELIADGVHVDPAAIRLLLKSKGPEGVMLITDGVAPVGMPLGRYRLGEMDVETRDGAVKNLDGILAGSVLTLDRALRNVLGYVPMPLANLVRMATWNQAELLGLTKKGRISPGADADLVLLSRDLEVEQVFLRGKVIE